ncbi:MAG: hypothetical protein CUN55_05150 [Phototrophicales bacterium]|nr:MAG: hypothetical protein CUN55_05150 [Phototrophicales bacterium]
MNELSTIIAMLFGASLLVVGLVAGYWRGLKRAKREYDLDALADVGQAILSAQLNLDALCEIVYQQSARIVNTRHFQLGLVYGNDYMVKVWFKNAKRLAPETFVGAAHEGLIGWVVLNKSGLLVYDYQKEWDALPAKPRYYDQNNPARSGIFVPLLSGGEVIGVIAVQSDTPRMFDREDLRRLTVLAAQAAGAIRNAQLYEAAQRQAERLRLISTVSRQITTMQPLNDLFEQIVHLVRDTFGYYAVNIFTIDKLTNQIVLGASSVSTFKNVKLEWGQGLVGWSAQHAKLVHVRDVRSDSRYLQSAALKATLSEVAVPLVVDQQVLGVLDIQSNQLDAFGEDDLKTIAALGDQLAIAIQESQTYHQERKQSERLNALIEAARAVVSILDISVLLDEVVDLIDDYFGYDRVHLFLREDDQIVFRAGEGPHVKQWLKQRLSYSVNDKGFIPWVVRHGRPIISGNVIVDERYCVGTGLDDTFSEMTVPIQMGNKTLGVLDIQSPHPDAFQQEDMILVQALADTVAVAIRNARLFANEMRRRMLSETLREVSTVLASSLDLESVLQEILLGLERVVAYTSAVILLLDEDKKQFEISAIHGAVINETVWEHPLPVDGIHGHIDALLTHIANEQSSSTQISNGDIIAKPLMIQDQVIGYLAIKRVGNIRFSPEEHEIVGTFANQAGVAIMNAQLYMAQKEEAWISTALLQVAEATSQAVSTDEVLKTVAKITPLLAGVEWCAVLLRTQDAFRVVEVSGIEQSLVNQLVGVEAVVDTWPPLKELVTRGVPIIVSHEDIPAEQLPVEVNFLQAVLLPLFAQGEIFGVIMIGQRQGDQPLTARKIELASGIANQAAIAIDRAQLYTAQQEEQWITTVVLQVAQAVNSQFDLDSTLEAIVRYTTLLVGVSCCCILEWNAETNCFIAAKWLGLPPEAELEMPFLKLSAEAAPFLTHLSKQRELVTAGQDADFPIPEALQNIFSNIDTILGIPLVAQGTTVGAMLVDNVTLAGASEERRLKILTGIADQCAMAIQTSWLQEEALAARTLEREMELARTIQLSLLPDTPPQISGYELAAYYRPARLVGGDFYDFIPLSDGKYGLVIADVTDKGVPAAMFMTICRTIIRSVASSRLSPMETLLKANKILVQDNRSDLFVTVWYGILDPHNHTLAYCSAGHNPPLLVHQNGQFTELKLKGIALGILNDATLREDTIDIAPQDVIVAYTDGVTEARRQDNLEFGEADLFITAVRERELPPHQLVNKIIEAVDKFTGDVPPFDDLTLFILKRIDH